MFGEVVSASGFISYVVSSFLLTGTGGIILGALLLAASIGLLYQRIGAFFEEKEVSYNYGSDIYPEHVDLDEEEFADQLRNFAGDYQDWLEDQEAHTHKS